MSTQETKEASPTKKQTKEPVHNEDQQGELEDDLAGEEEKHADGDKDNEHQDMGDEIQDLGEAMPADSQQTSEQDARSVYVKNVDYSATKEEVTDFFKSCGKITRVTIVTDKYTGHPKGFAYIEFSDKESVESALFLSESTFKGRTITVIPKRTNLPFRGRGGRGARRFSGRGGGYFPIRRGFGMFGGRPMRRGFRPY